MLKTTTHPKFIQKLCSKEDMIYDFIYRTDEDASNEGDINVARSKVAIAQDRDQYTVSLWCNQEKRMI